MKKFKVRLNRTIHEAAILIVAAEDESDALGRVEEYLEEDDNLEDEEGIDIVCDWMSNGILDGPYITIDEECDE